MGSDGVSVAIDQHFSTADMVRTAHLSVGFHPLDQPRRRIIAYAQLTLDVGRRGLLAFRDNLQNWKFVPVASNALEFADLSLK